MQRANVRKTATAVLLIVPVLCILAVTWGKTSDSGFSIVKDVAVSLYYLFFYTARWNGWIGFFSALICFAAGMLWQKKSLKQITGKEASYSRPAVMAAAFLGILWICFLIAVYKTGAVVNDRNTELALRMIWFIYEFTGCWYLGNWCFQHLLYQRHRKAEEEGQMAGREKKQAVLLAVLFLLCLIPMLYLGRYTYPQSDDYSYGMRPHLALMNGGGLWQVLQASWEEIKITYETWQGTFFSLFLMTLQPGIWGEQYYHIVPFLLIGLLTASTLFVLRVIFRKYMKTTGSRYWIVALSILLMSTQLVIEKPSAFYWYNGAIHYMGAYAFLLFLAGTVLLLIQEERRPKRTAETILAAILAVMVGGGNLVTGLITGVLFVYLLLALFVSGNRKKSRRLVIPFLFYAAAYGINIICPGNFVRQGESEGEFANPLLAILQSFKACLDSAFGSWMNWFVVLFLIALIPVMWRIVRKVEFSFPMPGVEAAASFCLLSAMYTPEIFATGTWEIGRVLNIIYCMEILLLTLNLLYFLGWLFHLKEMREESLLWENLESRCTKHTAPESDTEPGRKVQIRQWICKNGFALMVAGTFLLVTGTTAVAETGTLTSVLAVRTLASGEAKAYGTAMQENIEILKSDEPVAVLKRLPSNPEIFMSSDIAFWNLGTKSFYGKEDVVYEDGSRW